MHSAPPVRMACNTSGSWRRLHGVVGAIAAAVLSLWLCAGLEIAALPMAASALVAGALAAVACERWSRWPRCELAWDGQRWQRCQAPLPPVDGCVDVMLDWQAAMLLRFRAASGGTHWLVVRERDTTSTYALCRAALYARAATLPEPAQVR